MVEKGFEENVIPVNSVPDPTNGLGGAALQLFGRRQSDRSIAEGAVLNAEADNLALHIPVPRNYVLESRRGRFLIKRYIATSNGIQPIERD